MKRIRTEMYALVYKGRYVRDKQGMYQLFPKRGDAESLAAWRARGETTAKVTLTITPKEKP